MSLRMMLLLVLTAFCVHGARVAVWDPEHGTRESRFRIDLKALSDATAWLKEAGIEADRLTAAQVNDAAVFNAKTYDAFMLLGEAFPRTNIAAYKRFADEGIGTSFSRDRNFLFEG